MRRTPLLAALLLGCSDYDLTLFEGVDVWNQDPPDAVDILMVVDNSCSMDPYQSRLSQNFDEFISWFIEADVDYHIGVVTTDMLEPSHSGRIRGQVITADTPNAASVFGDLVLVGIAGAGYEMGLEAADAALTPPLVDGANAGFLREEASLSVIFVSDEQDSSPWPVNDYINGFFEVKGARSRDVFNASALTVTDESECTATQAAASSEGTRYVDVARQTGGIVANLCSSDFEHIVTELSLNASRLRDTFFLSSTPSPPSLQISLDDTIVGCDEGVWEYRLLPEDGRDRPAIVFLPGEIPQPDTRITARYDYGTGDPTGWCANGGTTP